MNKIESNDSNIPITIITNYLHKYFDPEIIFFSISLSSLNVNHQYYQDEMVDKLISTPKLTNFSFNVLNIIDQFRSGNLNVFNLIFTDESESLT